MQPLSTDPPDFYYQGMHLWCQSSLSLYCKWPNPKIIISDGAYGLNGFSGDARSVEDLLDWYKPHIKWWSQCATPSTTLWFWNTEIGWATVHQMLEANGWRYISCNIWNKGISHIAGNSNTKTLKHFPKVTEVCCQYVRRPFINKMTLQEWLIHEWRRTGLTMARANEACRVSNAASRKYLTTDRNWYPPSAELYDRLIKYANRFGKTEGKPAFSDDSGRQLSAEKYKQMIPQFHCPFRHTNVWSCNPVRGKERIKNDSGGHIHPNQKPASLVSRIIEASTKTGDCVWEPFGGTFSASVAASRLGRTSYASELNRRLFDDIIHTIKKRVDVAPLNQFTCVRSDASSEVAGRGRGVVP